MLLWSRWIILQETTGIIIIFTRMKSTQSKKSKLKTGAGVLHRQTKWKEGEINEYDVAFYLVIAVIHRLPLGAAETLTTEHYSFSPWHLLWDLHQSSPLRGYESKCVGTNNIHKNNNLRFIFFLLSCGNLEGQYVWFTPDAPYTAYSPNEDVNIVLKTDK